MRAVSPRFLSELNDQLCHCQHQGSRRGGQVNIDTAGCRNRIVVERAFNKLKNWRGLVTRRDKYATNYRGNAILASIVLWLQA